MLALFDFDGTITTRDTLLDFTRYALGTPRFLAGMLRLAPMLLRFKLKQISNTQAKEAFLKNFFAGWPEKNFNQKARKYALEQIDKIVRHKARERLAAHAGDAIVIVSASLENWLKPWCQKHGYQLIAGKAALSAGTISGKLAGPNCFGPEKVRRIEQQFRLSDFKSIYAYGDSRGDKEMLELADRAYLNFKKLNV